MAMPKKKISRANRGHRRSHDALTAPTVHNCPNCGSLHRPHNICNACGYYKGREIVAAKS